MNHPAPDFVKPNAIVSRWDGLHRGKCFTSLTLTFSSALAHPSFVPVRDAVRVPGRRWTAARGSTSSSRQQLNQAYDRFVGVLDSQSSRQPAR
jgi:hypothetical protein